MKILRRNMDHKSLTLQAFDKVGLSDGKILDIGCRDDGLKTYFEDNGMIWTGCDKYKNKNVDECLMEDLQYEDDSFDILFVCHSFEHTERPAETLREFRRVLKSDGILFISAPVHCEHQILKADADHINVLTVEQMARLCTYTNFKLENIWIEENTTGFIKDNSLITVCKKK